MPQLTKEEVELSQLDYGDDSSDDNQSGDTDSDSSADESSSDAEEETDSSSGGDGSDSGDSDSDGDGSSDEETGSASSDGSSESKNSKKKKKKGAKEEKESEEEDSGLSSIYKIKQISSKLSYLLDDLHKTFRPKSVPQIDPKTVFPYPCDNVLPYVYSEIPQHSPHSRSYYRRNRTAETIEELQKPLKSPISSPIRHGNNIDRGAGGNYIFPSYAAPPSKNEIKKLYRNYSDNERRKIAQNQQRKEQSQRRPKREENVWQNNRFSKDFMNASKIRRNAKSRANSSMRRLFNKRGDTNDEDEFDESMMPHTFDELYKHYDEQKRLIQQKQNKMNRMKNKMNWFKKNNNKQQFVNVSVAEKKPLMKRNHINDKNAVQLHPTKRLKETENNLLNKAAQILLGKEAKTKDFDVICPDSPDSLQEKILHIQDDDQDEEESRMSTFV